MKKLFIPLSVLLFAASTEANEVILDIPALVGKTKAEVSEVIGSPTSCSTSKYGEKCQFEKAETEVVFIKGKADWITVEGLDEEPFSDSTIELLGFKPHKPTFSNSFTKRWEPLEGLKSVSLFKGTNKSDYAYIKAYTK